MDSVLHLIGLAKRGGYLAVGEEPVGAVCRARDCRLLLVAVDAADNTFRRARHFADAGACLWVSLPYSREELGAAAGRRVCAMAAVTDVGLAAAIARELSRDNPEKFEQTAQKLQLKAQRVRQRRAEQSAHDKKLQRGGKKSKPYIPTRIKRAQKQQGK